LIFIIFVFIHQIQSLPMKLLDWIDKNKINWNYLSINPNAVQLLKANKDKIDLGYVIRKFKRYRTFTRKSN